MEEEQPSGISCGSSSIFSTVVDASKVVTSQA